MNMNTTSSRYIAASIIIIIGIAMSIYVLVPKRFLPNLPKTEQVVEQVATPAPLNLDTVFTKIYLATTTESRTVGLGDFEYLPANEAMLFIFDESDFHQFWMKDMRFPIDIVWINETFEVVSIEKKVVPESFPETFAPAAPARYVLETNSGIVDEIGLKVGQKVSFDEKTVHNLEKK